MIITLCILFRVYTRQITVAATKERENSTTMRLPGQDTKARAGNKKKRKLGEKLFTHPIVTN
jgi:hypothetical protein